MKALFVFNALLAVGLGPEAALAAAAKDAAPSTKGKPADFFQPNAVHTFHLILAQIGRAHV